MTSIKKATEDDLDLLVALGRQTFLESHGNSASKKDIDSYITKTYSSIVFETELKDPKNIYHIIYQDEKPVGYSKIILHNGHPEIHHSSVTKLERLYILKDYHDLKLGMTLFKFNVDLSKANMQTGTWLFVWKENMRAVNFYLKNGFKIIGSYDFKISETHSNPNHLMFLAYDNSMQ